MIEAMAKHLPPSASTLRLVDVGGAVGEVLLERRADLDVIAVAGDTWDLDDNSLDAVTAYGTPLETSLVRMALRALRPGGRLIVVDPHGEPSAEQVRTLEEAGYTRILVEPVLDDLAAGVLMRGEKPHTTVDTLERVNLVAKSDNAANDLVNFKGRYVHLLVRQTPNKPAWALTSDDQVRWEAAALQGEDAAAILAFSSLPNAVSFMQAAVLAGTIRDVNKVGKFSLQTAESWQFRVLLNPLPDVLHGQTVTMLPVDPTTAEMGDE
jgi:hypothetical protein